MKIVQTILKQDAEVGSLEKSDMLLDFIAPLIQDTEGVEEEDDEVHAQREASMFHKHIFFLPLLAIVARR